MEEKLGASRLSFSLNLFLMFLLLGTFVFSLGEGWTAGEVRLRGGECKAVAEVVAP